MLGKELRKEWCVGRYQWGGGECFLKGCTCDVGSWVWRSGICVGRWWSGGMYIYDFRFTILIKIT